MCGWRDEEGQYSHGSWVTPRWEQLTEFTVMSGGVVSPSIPIIKIAFFIMGPVATMRAALSSAV